MNGRSDHMNMHWERGSSYLVHILLPRSISSLKDVTNKVVGQLITTYQKEFRMDFLTQAKKYVPEFAAFKAYLKKLAKYVVNDIENQYHETSLKR